LTALEAEEQVILVLNAQHLDTQLSELLPVLGPLLALALLLAWGGALIS